MTSSQLAQQFHEIYERLAPNYNYNTRKESAKPWSEVPENNKQLMIATCQEIIDRLYLSNVQDSISQIANQVKE